MRGNSRGQSQSLSEGADLMGTKTAIRGDHTKSKIAYIRTGESEPPSAHEGRPRVNHNRLVGRARAAKQAGRFLAFRVIENDILYSRLSGLDTEKRRNIGRDATTLRSATGS